MGQGISCASLNNHGDDIFKIAELGDLAALKSVIDEDPQLLYEVSLYDRNSLLHVAASNGQIDVVCWLLEQSVNLDAVNRHKQTPLMLAAKHGKISCVEKLLHAGANILMFDSWRGRTCLHYAAYYGHSHCLKAILSTARTSHVALSWGFARFVNIRDGKGATPLHLAACHRRPECVHILLDHGALVCASTGRFGRYPGSTPLHLAARGGSLDCTRELLAWGADRLQRDEAGRIPYMVALKYKYGACATLLNPSSAEPLVWPSPLKFISELKPEAKLLLEQALMEANRERERTILKGTGYSIACPSHSEDGIADDSLSEASDTELCCICFDQVCTIEVRDCGHRMCAHCTLALCCHNKPNPTTASITPPVCPFCRSDIAHLVVAKLSTETEDIELSSSNLKKPRRSRNLSEGSSSFKGLSAFGKLSLRGSGRITADEFIDKPNE
ncbi:putative E3 ubiquitin-protein ligase XBAT31 isoform X1 [Amaranthus tricolor]|uniref:putative E3 ubiquitin-protein ligase XBAT31 isoform X1 n=1 Tax=Amaranthus tricolor TaxID=29722 RepID=UPI00258D3371|nr:putative E3 ubiquitin-protein ligase XBAT31 isoform X1 [Amaranthus tricolor]